MKQKTVKKSVLKQGYYYEEKSWYDALPYALPVPEYKEELFPKAMSHKEILNAYHIKPYTVAEAFAVASEKSATLKNGEYRLVYFIDGDATCRLHVYRYSFGKLRVYISRVDPDRQWDAGYGVLLSNGTLDTESNDAVALGNLDALTLDSTRLDDIKKAIELLKGNGFKVIKEF